MCFFCNQQTQARTITTGAPRGPALIPGPPAEPIDLTASDYEPMMEEGCDSKTSHCSWSLVATRWHVFDGDLGLKHLPTTDIYIYIIIHIYIWYIYIYIQLVPNQHARYPCSTISSQKKDLNWPCHQWRYHPETPRTAGLACTYRNPGAPEALKRGSWKIGMFAPSSATAASHNACWMPAESAWWGCRGLDLEKPLFVNHFPREMIGFPHLC